MDDGDRDTKIGEAWMKLLMLGTQGIGKQTSATTEKEEGMKWIYRVRYRHSNGEWGTWTCGSSEEMSAVDTRFFESVVSSDTINATTLREFPNGTAVEWNGSADRRKNEPDTRRPVYETRSMSSANDVWKGRRTKSIQTAITDALDLLTDYGLAEIVIGDRGPEYPTRYRRVPSEERRKA